MSIGKTVDEHFSSTGSLSGLQYTILCSPPIFFWLVKSPDPPVRAVLIKALKTSLWNQEEIGIEKQNTKYFWRVQLHP